MNTTDSAALYSHRFGVHGLNVPVEGAWLTEALAAQGARMGLFARVSHEVALYVLRVANGAATVGALPRPARPFCTTGRVPRKECLRSGREL